MTPTRFLILAALALAALPASRAEVTTSVTAFDNATVRPNGPRTGNNGKRFFNVEGASYGVNASFGVIRFDAADIVSDLDADLGAGAYSLTSVKLELIESNAAFTAPGTVNFAFSPDNALDISPANTGLVYNPATDPTSAQIPQTFITSGQFTTLGNTNNGQVDIYELLAPNAGGAALANAILGGGVVTLIVNDGDPTVAATWTGFNNTAGGPRLVVTAAPTSAAIPEPSSLALLAGGFPALMAFRRRK